MPIIRNYKDSDYKDVKSNLIDGNLYGPEQDTKSNLKKKIQRDPDSIIVAEINGKVVGNIFVVEDSWSTFLFRLTIKRRCRGQGIGSLLLAEAEKRLKNKKIKEVSIFVEDVDSNLKEWYKKRGYTSTKSYRFMYKKLQ